MFHRTFKLAPAPAKILSVLDHSTSYSIVPNCREGRIKCTRGEIIKIFKMGERLFLGHSLIIIK